MALNNYFYNLPLDLQEYILNIKNEEERKDEEAKKELYKSLIVSIFELQIFIKYKLDNPYRKFEKIYLKKNDRWEFKIIQYFKNATYKKIKIIKWYSWKKSEREGEGMKPPEILGWHSEFLTRSNFQDEEEEEEEDEDETDNENESEEETDDEDEK